MATITTPVSTRCVQPGQRLFTAADVAALPEQLPSGPVSFELHHGRLVPMSPPAARHGNLQLRIGSELMTQGEKKGHGRAYTEVGVVLERDPDHVLGPDAAFVANRSLPAQISSEGYLETIPQLIVEVWSKNDTAAGIQEKVGDYLHAGAQRVWVVNPASETVIEYRGSTPPHTFDKTGTLQCEDIIPGFRLSLADLLRE